MDYTERWFRGYYFWLMLAYGFGLALAFLAFGLSGVGQPALLYLVPCLLITISIVGWKELRNLWTGSRAIRLAGKLKTKCERAWGKEKMRRQVAKLRGAQGGTPSLPHTSANRSRSLEPSRQSGRGGRGGRGRGRRRGDGQDGGRGRGSGRMSGRGRGPQSTNRRSTARSASPNKDPQPTPVVKPPRLDSAVKSKSYTGAPPEMSPGSPRNRYSASLEGTSPSPRRVSKRPTSRTDLPEKPNLDDDGNGNLPEDNDVYFGDKNAVDY